MKASDLVIYIGCGTNDHTTIDFTMPDPLATVVQMDIDPVELGRSFVNCLPLLADAKVGLKQLSDAVSEKERKSWRDTVRANLKATLRAFDAQLEAAEGMTPVDLCRAITRTLPDDGIVVSDTGYSAIWSCNHINVKPGQFYTRAAGSLGWSFPASLGVKCAQPDRPVVCFLGDGAFYYYFNELETAVRNGINTVTVINNNCGYNQCGAIHEALTGKEEAADRYQFADVDFSKIAEGFGVWYKRVEKKEDLDAAIKEALASGKPALVECMTIRDFHPLAFQ